MEDDSILKSKITASSLNQNLENLIYEIRGQQVMLDSDLAKLYQCANGTKDINRAVRRNPGRFPTDFYFQLTDGEKDLLRFHFGTAINMSRTNPHVFTEQGVAMLASVLRTDVAEEVSIRIMRSFIEMRKYFAGSFINDRILIDHENRLLSLEEALDKFKEKAVDRIFFEGELYDAYSLLLDIFSSAKEEIIIIDNYIGKELLDILKNIKKRIIINSKNINNTLKKKYESQYKNIAFLNNNSFHDRFIIIDKKTVYHSGASFKDLGKKCFAIHRFRDREYLEKLLDAIRPKNML